MLQTRMMTADELWQMPSDWAERIPAGKRTVKFFEGAPDLAVEVVSPGDTTDELDEKIADYLAAGCQMIWVVHPKISSITVCRPGSQPREVRETDQLDGQELVPGFHCPVAEIFAFRGNHDLRANGVMRR